MSDRISQYFTISQYNIISQKQHNLKLGHMQDRGNKTSDATSQKLYVTITLCVDFGTFTYFLFNTLQQVSLFTNKACGLFTILIAI